MNPLTIAILLTLFSGSLLIAEDQPSINIGYLHSQGWFVVETATSPIVEIGSLKTIQFTEAGIRIGDEWLGQIHFNDGELQIHGAKDNGIVLPGKSEIGTLRIILKFEDRTIHVAKLTC